ncbi:hypothetical protein C1N91_01730 [Curtobacterium sp. SGAir0471]|uniref:hypothetical protein n=1 Tax=Curtobacterium sp. SGAir0471 TaxID=2070337 RepID=UPI0010CCCC6A|nr:hypothetical protein [Curtobacterium sp. SGAir0471]QCR42456.1 hypothetical protein C1N91_01730 [Curtobacterium sp. SGAir0471]
MAKFAEYQWFSSIAPNFGGPKGVLAVAALVGIGLYKGGEFGVKKLVQASRVAKKKKDDAAASATYTFLRDAEDGHGLVVKKGCEFRVLSDIGKTDLGETRGIELIGDERFFHYVEAAFLEGVSNWRRNDASSD